MVQGIGSSKIDANVYFLSLESSPKIFASSTEFVGEVWLGKVAERVK